MEFRVSTTELADLLSTGLGHREVNLIYQPAFQAVLVNEGNLERNPVYPTLLVLHQLKLACLRNRSVFKAVEGYDSRTDTYRISVYENNI